MLITNKTQNNRIQFLFGDTFKTGISSARSLPLYSPFIFSFGFNFLICTFIYSGSFAYIFFKNSQILFFTLLIITFICSFFILKYLLFHPEIFLILFCKRYRQHNKCSIFPASIDYALFRSFL